MKRSTLSLIVTILILATAAGSFAQADPGPLTPVPQLDLQKYAGTWYEIAKYPNKFQKQCVGNTTATYTIEPDGDIEVLNRCLKKDGTVESAKGKAKVADKGPNSKLKVRFAPGFLSFLPFVWADYWVIDLDTDYKYAVIGEPDRKYFWILSRTAEMDEKTYQAILRRAEEKGFNPAKVERTPQGIEAMRGTVTR